MRSVLSDEDGSFTQAMDAHPELISRFVNSWGEPGECLRVEHATSRRAFAVVAFDRSAVARVVTAGLGACLASDHAPLGVELLVVMGRPELSEIGAGRVQSFVADIGTHLLRHSVRPTEGSVVPQTSIAPWKPDALVFDTPRGEPESLERFVADGCALRLLWVIPVYEEEAALVQQNGMGALDALVERTDHSLADLRRPNLATERTDGHDRPSKGQRRRVEHERDAGLPHRRA
jgi:Suppressor of fused protein (SUFU)